MSGAYGAKACDRCGSIIGHYTSCERYQRALAHGIQSKLERVTDADALLRIREALNRRLAIVQSTGGLGAEDFAQ
mgnify:CR=1 FL=1